LIKLLFQTQVILKKKYIHRLHVLNPLTNTDIIGHVQFFKVQPLNVSIVISDCPSPTVKQVEKGELINWTLGHHMVSLDGTSTDLKEYKQLLDKKSINVPANVVFQPKKSARSLSWNITVQIPNSNFENVKMSVSPGQVTQFAQAVPLEQVDQIIPKTQKFQKRVLSYRNAISASGVPASFHEWTRMLQTNQEDENYDNVDFSALARSDQIQEEPITWDAILFATDDDYLASSAVRKIFLDNALSVEDAKLFEMKEYTGEEEIPRREVYIPEQPMCELM
jgi:hypothetical protein